MDSSKQTDRQTEEEEGGQTSLPHSILLAQHSALAMHGWSSLSGRKKKEEEKREERDFTQVAFI